MEHLATYLWAVVLDDTFTTDIYSVYQQLRNQSLKYLKVITIIIVLLDPI